MDFLKKRLLKFVNKNLIYIFLGTVAFTVFIGILKFTSSRPATIYAKVKLSQGLWWANTTNPGVWFLKSLKKGDKEYNFLGKPVAEILYVRYYPTSFTDDTKADQVDIYLDVKLTVSKDRYNYSFKRATIGVGSPIDLNFPNAQVSGTIIEINSNQMDDHYIEKNITLTKKLAFPWEYDAIKIGDQYFDGENVVFEITQKQSIDTPTISSDYYGNIDLAMEEPRKYITIKGKIKLEKNSTGQLIYGEEQPIKINSFINIVTNNIILPGFYIASLD